MTVAETNSQLAKESLISNIRTSRTTKRNIIFNYLNYEKMGYDMKKTRSQMLFEAYPTMTMQDIIDFNQKYIKGQKKTVMVLGKEEDMDFNALSKYGKVTKLQLEDIFGF
jgi:predicted Zn-dependent peptidase